MDIRDEILEAIIKEITGPSSNPYYKDEETGEELLLAGVHGAPKSRYGAGMLYPQQSINIEINDSESSDENYEEEGLESTSFEFNESEGKNVSMTELGGSDEEPVGLANQYLPSAMGFTIRFRIGLDNDLITLNIKSSYYEKGVQKLPQKKRNKEGEVVISESKGNPYLVDYWIRRPINPNPITLNIYGLFKDNKKCFDKVLMENHHGESWLILRIYNRTSKLDEKEGYLTFTFVILNNLKSTTDSSANSDRILFQNGITLITDSKDLIAPYREKSVSTDTDEERELNLLYRLKRVFAIGHGTSVKWETKKEDNSEIIEKVETCVIPVYDLPQVAPTSFVQLSMLELSDLGDWSEAKESLSKLTEEYGKWIDEINHQAETQPELENYRDAAKKNVKKCRNSLARIQKGIDYLLNLDDDSDIVKCFRWMNRAMIWQQQRSKTKLRKWIKSGDGKSQKLILEGIDNSEKIHNFPSLEEYHKKSIYNGRWRPFQLAFILMNLESIVNPDSDERKIVDLIWFPTGGGKTEAYLGLTAFNIFYRRIKGRKNWNWDFYSGTSVLMRYTLRLLTTQQYERASSLICACDQIRKHNEDDLGEDEISIGLWVGGSSTPNSNQQAISNLNLLTKDVKAAYNFVVMKCPCCGAQIGKVENARKNEPEKIKGIFKEDGKNGAVYFKCENSRCEYSESRLPLQVIDELIYENPPTLLFGTVDKFAMVTWRPEAGRLFGFRKNKDEWKRICPPDLIIQDELHLIAGPLGTMVGLYETMIQTLCNDYDKKEYPFIESAKDCFIPPKVIASSATISRAYEQAQSLYGIENREQLNIFPAQGLQFGNTWFSEEKSLNDYDEEGKQKFPGRRYVGILASGYPSAQTTIVRSYSAVLQKIKELSESGSEDNINYYWTLLGYFNSIRELGGASSLVYGDIRERLGQIQKRDLVSSGQKRFLNRIEELTSRINSSEIPSVLKKLEESFNGNKNQALDICLATNMVATGVDISRLGLMFIHGQPKTTAEYIQASSRVGRKVPEGPGLIFTLYSPSKPRDKSQYEQFYGYHSRVYSNVEPTSVTPFSINARERGLHAVLIGLIRHFARGGLRENPEINEEEFEELNHIVSELIIARCQVIDQEEVLSTRKLLKKRISFWKKGFQSYGDAGNREIKNRDNFFPLMYANSAEVREKIIKENRSLSTPTSLRGVDTESMLSIYSIQDKDGD